MKTVQLIADLADECIRDECSYAALPQHVMEFKLAVRDFPEYQDALAEFLQDESLWGRISPELLHGHREDWETISWVVEIQVNNWARQLLELQVNSAINAKEGGWVSEEPELRDEFGGAL